jgi:hypothetical protein
MPAAVLAGAGVVAGALGGGVVGTVDAAGGVAAVEPAPGCIWSLSCFWQPPKARATPAVTIQRVKRFMEFSLGIACATYAETPRRGCAAVPCPGLMIPILVTLIARTALLLPLLLVVPRAGLLTLLLILVRLSVLALLLVVHAATGVTFLLVHFPDPPLGCTQLRRHARPQPRKQPDRSR